MQKRAIVVLVLIILCAPLCVDASIPRYSTDPNDFVSASIENFWVNGERFRFVGFNTRGMCHYGFTGCSGDSNYSDREVNLSTMHSIGARVARVYVSCRAISRFETYMRLNLLLDIAAYYDVRLICSFTDIYQTGFNPLGDDIYYNVGGMLTMLGPEFFTGGYQDNYLPQVQYVVNELKNDPTVFAWELGNELKTPWDDWTDIMPFSHHVATAIRAIDPNHMIALGTASRVFMNLSWQQATELYQDFDFLTMHVYNGDDADDYQLAADLGKPYIIEEAGFSKDDFSNRPAHTDADIAKWVGRKARGYMNWGFMATDYWNGDGDHTYGIDPTYHSYDWDDYLQVYSNWASTLADTSRTVPEVPTGVKASDAAWVDRVEVTWHEMLFADEYAVFRSDSPFAAKTQVSGWQTGRVFQDASVQPGKLYCYWVKSRNELGTSDFSEYNTGYASTASPMSVLAAKGRTDQTPVYVTDGTVTAVFEGEFYIQQSAPHTAIGVICGETVHEGDQVDVFGRVTTVNGERKISALSIYPNGQ